MRLEMMKRRIFYYLVISFAVGSVVLGQQNDVSTKCPTDLAHTTAMKLYNNTCYQFVSVEKYWHQARDHCLQNSGRLVKIDDPDTNRFIVDSLNDLWWRNQGVWIGLHDIADEMNWEWTGYELYWNEPVHWTNWGRGHPGAFLNSRRDCVRMVRGGGQWKWHETLCNSLLWHYRFICEYRANLPAQATSEALGGARQPLDDPSPKSANRMAESSKDETGHLNFDETKAEASVAVISPEETKAEASLQLEEKDENTKYGTAFLAAMGCIILFTLATVILFTFYIRRRRLRRKHQDSPEICTISKGKELGNGMIETGSYRSKAVGNIYVDADVTGRVTTRLASNPLPEISEDSDLYEEDTEDEEGQEQEAFRGSSGTKRSGRYEAENAGTDYDTPKPANIYDEIPDNQVDEEYPESCHIYEALAEVKKQTME